VEKLKKR